jgi:hypothetical protein
MGTITTGTDTEEAYSNKLALGRPIYLNIIYGYIILAVLKLSLQF